MLRRGRRGQVMIGLHLRTVVGVDQRPGRTVPGTAVPQRQARRPDTPPVHRDAVTFTPQPLPLRIDRSLPAVVAAAAAVQPQLPGQVRGGVAAGDGRVLQPLLQQPHRPPRQRHGLGRSPPFDIGQQHRRVTGPVDVADAQVSDPVRDNPAVTPQQQLIGQHDVGAREQFGQDRAGTATAVDVAGLPSEVLGDLHGTGGAALQHQPPQVVARPLAARGIVAPAGGRHRPLMDGERLIDDPPAGGLQMHPLLLLIGHQRITPGSRREPTPAHQGGNPRAQGAAVVGETLQHPAGRPLALQPGLHPVLGQHRPGQRGGATGCLTRRHEPADVPQPGQIHADRVRGVEFPVRPDQAGQTGQQVTGQIRRPGLAHQQSAAAPVTELAPDPQRIGQHLSRHHRPPPSAPDSPSSASPVPVSNSLHASRSAVTRSASPATPEVACW